MGLDDRVQAAGDSGDGLVPADRLELPAALGPDATQRRRQPPGVVGALQVAVDLAAQPPLRDRVVGVAPDVDGAAAGSVDRDLPATGVGAVVRADAGDDRVRVGLSR